MDANGETRAQGRKGGFRRIWRGIIAEQPRWLIDYIRRQGADEIEMAELTFRDGFALERLDCRGIGFAFGDQLVEALTIDRGQTSGERGFDSDLIYAVPFPSRPEEGQWLQTVLY